jgi:hypothetical protein
MMISGHLHRLAKPVGEPTSATRSTSRSRSSASSGVRAVAHEPRRGRPRRATDRGSSSRPQHGRRPWPPRMGTSSRWSRGRRSAWPLGTPRSVARVTSSDGSRRPRHGHATRTFVEPIAVGWGTGSPCSRKDWMCRGIASAMSSSTSSRERPAATQPGRSGTYAPQASPSWSITTTYSVTILPSRPACLPPDRPKRTLRHFITRLARRRHRSRPVGMAELTMRTNLPVEAPAVSFQRADDVSHLHELRAM